ncbi:MAG: type II toxin-antitoxin system HigA family antitoxin [Pirellulales bacterium]
MSTATKLHPDYLALIQRFPLRPIRSRRGHGQAMKLVRELAPVEEGGLTAGQQDYLDALTVLLEDYDRRNEERGDLSGLVVLKSLMEARGMTVTELGRVIGSQPNASLILGGRRGISRAVMGKLGDHFGVDPAVFFTL